MVGDSVTVCETVARDHPAGGARAAEAVDEAVDERAPGTMLLPGYRVVGLLQSGRDFETYDAWSERRYSRCVVKVIRTDRVRSRSLPVRLALEGRLLTELDHPHLVRGYEMVTDPVPAVVIETLTGATLSHLLGRGRNKLAAEGVAHLGCQLASALQFLHDNGYLHLDVKPGNVIVAGGTAKLIDLSLTQPPGPVARGLGTDAYLSPEQATGGTVTAASDVWGLGVTLYEAATGVSPFADRGTPSSAGASVPAGGSASGRAAASGRHARSHEGGVDRCPDCGEALDYPQTRLRAPKVRRLRRLPRPVAEVIDAALEPAAADRPTLAQVHDGMREYAGMGDLPW
jgi:serine/threonine protein kinase